MSQPVKALLLSLPSPCETAWDDMRPEASGRYCESCCQSVADFSAMTDAELLVALRQAGAGCGRFRADQLERALYVPPPQSQKWIRQRFFASILALCGFTKAAVAQSGDALPPLTQITPSLPAYTTQKTSSRKAPGSPAIESISIQNAATVTPLSVGTYQNRRSDLTVTGARSDATVYIVDGVILAQPVKKLSFWQRLGFRKR